MGLMIGDAQSGACKDNVEEVDILGILMQDATLWMFDPMRCAKMPSIRQDVLGDAADCARVMVRRAVLTAYNGGVETSIPDLCPQVKILENGVESFT